MATIAVFGSSRTDSDTSEWADAEALGRALALAGHTVVTGGYFGAMEAVSKGAFEAGGHVVGVTTDALFPHRGGPNQYVTEVRDHPTIASRIADLIDSSDAAIALPGSIGTATELLVGWNRIYVDPAPGAPPWTLFAVGEPWQSLVPHLARALGTPADSVRVVPNAREAWVQAIEILG